MQCTTRYLKLIDLESTFSKKGNTNQRVLKGLSVLMYLPYKITIAYLLSLHKKNENCGFNWDFYLINILRMFNVATNAITEKPYLLQKFSFQ